MDKGTYNYVTSGDSREWWSDLISEQNFNTTNVSTYAVFFSVYQEIAKHEFRAASPPTHFPAS